MFCKNCGKEIDDKAAVCVYCGVATKELYTTQTKSPNPFGIVGFIFSLFFCFLGLIFSSIGIAKKEKYNSCNGLAIAGLVISIISLCFWGLIFLALIGGEV